MDNKIIFVRTSKGDAEIGSRANDLSGDIKRTLMLVDGKSTVEVLLKRAAPSFRSEVGNMLQQLEDGGFILDKAKEKKGMTSPRMAMPKMAVPTRKKVEEQQGEDLDFTTVMRAPSPEELAAEGEKLKKRAEEEARAKQEAEAKARAEAEAKAKRDAEAARLKAEQEARAKAEAEAKARAEAEAKAKRDAEAARLKAEQEAKAKQEAEAKALEAAKEKARKEIEEARLKAKHEAAKAKAEAEVARRKAEEEAARVKAEIEAAKAKAEAEAKALAEAQEKARKEIEAARKKAEEEAAKARAEAEAARKKAEEEAAKARAEAEAARKKAEEEAKALAEAQEKARKEIEAAREKAEQEAARARAEAEAARLEAEQEAARVRAEEEAARLKAEEEAAQARAEAAAEKERAAAEAKAQAEAEAKAKLEAAEQERAEAEAKAHAQAEEARLKAEQEAAKAEEEAAKAQAEAQAKIKQEEEKQNTQEVQPEVGHGAEKAHGTITGKFRATPESARSMIATVLFFDVVGYTKKSVSNQIELKRQFNELVSQFIEGVEEAQRIILDTGDGAAIGFLQHPEDALEVALEFREAATANHHRDYPDLNVRIGIHLGPVKIVKDMNGQFNMVGDGINDAQRIMSFAGTDQIFISRAYYDVVSRLNAEYAGLFKYRGVQKDKHGREHQVYQIVVGDKAAGKQPAGAAEEVSAESDFSLGPIELGGLGGTSSPTEKEPPPAKETPQKSPEELAAEQKAKAQQEEEARKQAEEEAKRRAKEEEEARKQAEEEAKAEAERRAKEEEEGYKLAAEQAKAWEEAEKRAKAEAEVQARIEQQEAEKAAKAAAKKAPKPGKVRRKPLPWGKIGASLFALLLVAVAVAPYVWPMQGYLPKVEKRMSALLKQPVHVGGISAALFPTPKLEMRNVTVGAGKEIEAGSVVLHFGFGSLFAGTKSIDDAELNNLRLSDKAFDKTLSWLALAGGDPVYPLAHATLNNAQISTEKLNLPAFNGSLAFAQGHFSNAALTDKDGKFKVELGSKQGQLSLSVSIKDAALPILPGLHFASLDANGKVNNGEADLGNIDATLYGGTLGGNVHLSWKQGWVMQGRITVKGVDIQQALPKAGIEGEFAGNADYAMRAASLPSLGGNPGVEGNFALQKGVISDMDMVETVRLAGSGAPAQRGRTHFDELKGRLVLGDGVQHYRQLHLSAGVLSAFGHLDIDSAGDLDGRLAAELSVRPGTVPLMLSGKVGQPELRVGR